VRRVVLVASIALVAVIAIALFTAINIGNKASEEKAWRVCPATLLDPFEREQNNCSEFYIRQVDEEV